MSFCNAWHLLQKLEGGKFNDPIGGPTNIGMTQDTWIALGFPGSVLDASLGQIAAGYRIMWDGLQCYIPHAVVCPSCFESTPDPADAVAFQLFVNIPPTNFIKAFQGVVGVRMDGILGPKTLDGIQHWNGRGMELSDKILVAQHWYYISGHNRYKKGLLNRCERVQQWLMQQ